MNSNLIAELIAGLIDRVAGSWVTTIVGILTGVGGILASCTTIVPVKYQTIVGAGSALVAAVALALSKDSAPKQ